MFINLNHYFLIFVNFNRQHSTIAYQSECAPNSISELKFQLRNISFNQSTMA